MRSITLYNKTSTGKTKVLEITVDGDTLTTRWWQEDGTKKSKIQKASEKGEAKNVGKANEISASENAEDLFDRKVTKKKEEGYTENKADLEVQHDPFALPKQFAPSKPKTKITDVELERLVDSGNCYASLKRDGQRCFIFKMPDGSVKVMSRRMKDYTEHVPHIVRRMLPLPRGTILDAELVAHPTDDDYDYVGSILRSKPEKAVKKQINTTPLIPYVFDILYAEGQDISGQPRSVRHMTLTTIQHANKIQMLVAQEYQIQNLDQLQDMLDNYVKDGGEGLVVWDGAAPTVLRYDGKPSRKGGAYKLKPVYEDDFYVRGYELGKGKNADVVGAIFIFQKDKDGNEIAVGKCGGFTGSSDIRRQLLDEDLDSGTLVIQIEFSKRNKTGLRFPVMQRIRRDKTAEECIYDD